MYNTKEICGYIPFETIKKGNLKKYAKQFSEGNIHLEQLLIDCGEEGIETFACCIGHEREEGEYDPPYIVLCIPYERKKRIYRILASVYDIENIFMRIGNSCYKGNNNSDIFLYISSFNADILFSTISRAITSKQKLNLANEDEEEIVKIVELINDHRYDSCNLVLEQFNKSKYEAFINYVDEQEAEHFKVIYQAYTRDEIRTMDHLFDDHQLQEVEDFKVKVK